MRKELTILIPTYNRKERLKHTLDCILKQGHLGEYELIICDNHSDYDVKEMVVTEFPPEFSDNVRVNRWNFNTGMSTNISICHLLVNTKWCFWISDDDSLRNGTLDRVFHDMATVSSNVCAIRYSIAGFGSHENVCINSIDSYLDYYEKRKPVMKRGEIIYLNQLYNTDILNEYSYYYTAYSYTYISFIVPVVNALVEKKGCLMMSSFCAYDYCINKENGWSVNPKSHLAVVLGARTFYDIPFNLTFDKKKRLQQLATANLMDGRTVLRIINLIENKRERQDYYRALNRYLQGPKLKIVFYRINYYLHNMFNIDFMMVLRRLIRKEK